MNRLDVMRPLGLALAYRKGALQATAPHELISLEGQRWFVLHTDGEAAGFSVPVEGADEVLALVAFSTQDKAEAWRAGEFKDTQVAAIAAEKFAREADKEGAFIVLDPRPEGGGVTGDWIYPASLSPGGVS